MEEQHTGKFERLKAVAHEAPEKSGVYIMRDPDGKVIYIGKAKTLRNRLSSYFTGRKDIKTRTLVSHIDQIEYIVTKDEYEALLLENNLIKQHSPRYNINLKDGKTYPMIRVTAEDFPRVFRTRRMIPDGSLYFGPYPAVQTIDTYLKLIEDLFPLRRCRQLKKRSSPCMYYHIGKCSAPCAGKVGKEEYAKTVARVVALLEGKTDELLAWLKTEMESAAAKLQFERAASLRDSRDALAAFKPENQVFDFDQEDRDYIAWADEGPLVSITVFQMRQGRLTGRDLFRARSAAAEDETVADFILSYYSPAHLPPPKIFLAKGFETDLVSEYLDRELGSRVVFADGGSESLERRHQASLALATQNAREDIIRRLREGGDPEAVEALRRELSLSVLPTRIEGFDIAQLNGKFPVASLVSFENGVPDKKNYRYFRLKSLGGKIDDFASMREAVSRRYLRLVNEEADLPDLILIDGGIGQVNAAAEVLTLLELDIPIVGLAKREEELYFPDSSKPLVLPRHSPALRLLQRVRDETHRFATGLNQRLRSKTLKLETLEGIEGIGPSRAKKLITLYGSVEAIGQAPAEEVAERGSIPLSLAERIREKLNP
jgi:excinuclease ABC subunit C